MQKGVYLSYTSKFGLGSIEIRGEYEYFDVEGANDVYLLSVGLVYSFQ